MTLSLTLTLLLLFCFFQQLIRAKNFCPSNSCIQGGPLVGDYIFWRIFSDDIDPSEASTGSESRPKALVKDLSKFYRCPTVNNSTGVTVCQSVQAGGASVTPELVSGIATCPVLSPPLQFDSQNGVVLCAGYANIPITISSRIDCPDGAFPKCRYDHIDDTGYTAYEGFIGTPNTVSMRKQGIPKLSPEIGLHRSLIPSSPITCPETYQALNVQDDPVEIPFTIALCVSDSAEIPDTSDKAQILANLALYYQFPATEVFDLQPLIVNTIFGLYGTINPYVTKVDSCPVGYNPVCYYLCPTETLSELMASYLF